MSKLSILTQSMDRQQVVPAAARCQRFEVGLGVTPSHKSEKSLRIIWIMVRNKNHICLLITLPDSLFVLFSFNIWWNTTSCTYLMGSWQSMRRLECVFEQPEESKWAVWIMCWGTGLNKKGFVCRVLLSVCIPLQILEQSICRKWAVYFRVYTNKRMCIWNELASHFKCDHLSQ